MPRIATIERTTRETTIRLHLNLDGNGHVQSATGIGFFDHMLEHLGRHGLFDLQVSCQGDLHIDAHHSVEDVGICLGQALHQALGNKAGIRRFGHSILPMDEVLVTAAVDLSGRPACVWHADLPRVQLGAFPAELAEEFWRAVVFQGHFNLHVLLHHGRNVHHMVEAIFKACARALRMAVELDARTQDIPSTKGLL